MKDISNLQFGRYSYYPTESNDCVYVRSAPGTHTPFNEIEDIVIRHFIDDLGFLSKTFRIKQPSDKTNPSLIAVEIKFTDEGHIMAKLHGILE